MKLRTCWVLLSLLTFSSSVSAQTAQPSATYGKTLKLLQTWLDSEKNTDLARLFAMGDARASDFRIVCRGADEKIASAAFYVLQLLGKSECVDCGNSISRKHKGISFACESNLADRDFKRIEELVDAKRRPAGYDCGDIPDPLDTSLVYALVLDGSPRSRLVLRRMLAFAEACTGGYLVDILKEAPSLFEDAERMGHNLKFETGSLESVVRASAFFLPAERRKDSGVDVIAYNNAGDRLLLEVSYTCGLLCGRGYHVVLRKDGPTWQYALVRMTWIS